MYTLARWLFLLLFLPAVAVADFSVGGIDDPASVGGIDNPASVGGIDAPPDTPPATNFTLLESCKAAYLMTSSGSETDVSGNNETLTESGDAPTSAAVPSGYTGTSRDFERSDPDFLYHADGGSTDIYGADQPLTIIGWVRTENNTNDQVIVCKGGTGSDLQYYLRYDASDDGFWFCMSANSTPTQVCAISADGMENDVWTHVAAVYNDTDMRVYINGVLSSNSTYNPRSYSNGIQNGTGVFRVGSFGGSSHYDGLIYELGIFDEAFSAAQVAESYATGLNGANSSGE